MKKALVAIAALLALAWPALSAGEAKIGVVDLQKIVNESEKGKRATGEIEALVQKRQAEIDEKEAEFEKLKKELEQKAVALSEEALKKRKDELQEKEQSLKRLVAESTAELQKLQRQRQAELQKELQEVITRLGKEKGLSVILPDEILLYYDEKALDITEAVIKKFDEGAKAQKEAAPEKK
ncbi:MAG: OmpH family outer membrane protein [Thermodesulfovibrionales bacterium]